MDLPLPRTPEKYEEFSSHVRRMLDARRQGAGNVPRDSLDKLLNHGSIEATHKLIPRALRVKDGIFFSSNALANAVAQQIPKSLLSFASIGDPTCGAGDLLLACAKRINKTKRLPFDWSSNLHGTDIHSEFISAAKARMELYVALACADDNFQVNFPQIRQSNYFNAVEEFGRLDVLVMNPPFGRSSSDKSRSWAQGNVQTAALFIEAAVNSAKVGQHIIAVLPDVLRSGTRYAKWRTMITSQARLQSIKVWGRFDEATDVDVFIVHLVKMPARQAGKSTWAEHAILAGVPRLKEFFNVCIGPVVLHRLKPSHSEVPFLQVRGAPANGETEATDIVKFNGKLIKPPFVAIRRTSNPADAKRVIATLVRGVSEIAVENHLIVVVPRDKKIETCRLLLKHLSTTYVDDWINDANRCRHLTKKIVEDLPLGDWV